MDYLKWIVAATATTACIAMVGCKTTEQNYRAAYEVAKEKHDSVGGIDNTIYSRMRPKGSGIQIVAGSDTLSMHTMHIAMTENGGATKDNIRRYCVVVGQFKQLFNARSMRERLINSGYQDAMILNTAEPLYYVVAGSVSTTDEIAALVEHIRTDRSLLIRDPFPWILRPAHLAR